MSTVYRARDKALQHRMALMLISAGVAGLVLLWVWWRHREVAG